MDLVRAFGDNNTLVRYYHQKPTLDPYHMVNPWNSAFNPSITVMQACSIVLVVFLLFNCLSKRTYVGMNPV